MADMNNNNGTRPVTRTTAARPATARPATARPASAHPAQKTGTRPATGARKPVSGKTPAKRRKKKSNPMPAILILAVLVVLAILLITGVFGKKNDNTNTNKPTNNTPAVTNTNNNTDFDTGYTFEDDDMSDLVASEKITYDITDLSVNENLSEEWFNVLLLGGDTKVLTERGRTDSMIICSINRKTGRVKLTSIMRDTAVQIDGKTRRINTAYFYGGAKQAMKTVNEYFNMNITNYVYVDFNGFAKIAEELGGVEMDITQSEMESINENVTEHYIIMYRQGVMDYDTALAGYESNLLDKYGSKTPLTGEQCLGYARIRKLDSDYARAERQRKVLNALMLKMKGADISKIMTTVAKCADSYITNMDIQTIVSVASLVLGNGDMSGVESMRLPVSGTYKEEARNNDAMLYDMDVSANSRELYNFIYNN